MDAAQMTKTKERSSHQDPEAVRSMEDEVEDMADAYMQGNVIDLYDDDEQQVALFYIHVKQGYISV